MRLRVGLGSDLHRLVPGTGLRLGGLDIPCAFAAEAVSDGDVLLHAVIDAWLGALGLGDIGDRFPASSVKPGEDSRILLKTTLSLPGAPRARIINLDCIIELERPRLSPWKADLRASLAALLDMDPARVNVKAKTAEGLGPVGLGQAVAAQAALLLEVES